MTTYKHIVQVHPVENGEVNFDKVELERKFESKTSANVWIRIFNYAEEKYGLDAVESKAVYRGRVNDITGELE